MSPDTISGKMSGKLYEILRLTGMLNDPEKMKEIHASIEHLVAVLNEGRGINPIEFVRTYYRVLDKQVAKMDITNVPCKRGCSYCCHINVTINELEALAISDYCNSKGIKIDRTYLLEQLKVPAMEISLAKNSACVFLKDNQCSIYEVRPTGCRTYFVTTPAEQCNTKRYSPSEFHVVEVHMLGPELIISAMDQFVKQWDRMPAMLMPYAQ